MRALLLFCLIAFISTESFPQKSIFYNKKREYHLRALYIDIHGDTILNEIVILKPLGRRWWPQPWLQESIRYIYSNDSSAFRRYVDPDPYFRERNLKFDKKGKMRIRKSEITGCTITDDGFYMHPPRRNQYRMLFYAPHPWIHHGYYFDSIYPYHFKREMFGTCLFNQIYNASILPDTTLFGHQAKLWALHVQSTAEKGVFADDIYDSSLDALFTLEFGFIKMHYTFEIGIKIQFDLEEVVEL